MITLRCKYCFKEKRISEKTYNDIRKVFHDFEYVCSNCRSFHQHIQRLIDLMKNGKWDLAKEGCIY